MESRTVDSIVPEQRNWMRRVFESLAGRTLSRNRFFFSFDGGDLRHAHRRFLLVRSLEREAQRLNTVPGSYGRADGPGAASAEPMTVRLESPALRYRREAALLAHEWDWLQRQPGMRQLLEGAPPAAGAAPSVHKTLTVQQESIQTA